MGFATLEKCLPLNLNEPTWRKRKLLRETSRTYLNMVKDCFAQLGSAKSETELHRITYHAIRERYGVASQLCIEARRSAWRMRNLRIRRLFKASIRFDKRLFSFAKTARNNPVLSLRLHLARVGMPINRDGAYRRFVEHLAHGWKAKSILMTEEGRFHVHVEKPAPKPYPPEAHLGVDVNSRWITVSIVRGKKVLRQLYLGKETAVMQKRFEDRRSILQRHRDKEYSHRAGLKLQRLSGRQKRYVKTSLWILSHKIANIAKEYRAYLAIERLRHIKRRRGEMGKEARRKVNRIPYALFRHTLSNICAREAIPFGELDGRYTSQTCPRCGSAGRDNWHRYHLFRCRRCGYEANRDRVASLNIARRAGSVANPLLYRTQSSPSGAPVSVHTLRGEDG